MLLPRPVLAVDRTIPTQAGTLKVKTVTDGLAHPWGLAFLPDGQMLVTERPGTFRFVAKNGTKSTPLTGVPTVFAEGQGGLLDVAIDPDFPSNRLVYLTYSEPDEGGASAPPRLWRAASLATLALTMSKSSFARSRK